MTFIQQVFASFIGTLFGFIFAILLFFITNAIKSHFVKKTLRRHLKRELLYDISLLQEWIEEVTKVLRKITADDKAVFSYLRYSSFQRYFMQEAFKSGIMYDTLNNEDISNLNIVLMHLEIGVEQYVNSFIQQWKDGKEVKTDILHKFEFEKDELQKNKKYLQQIVEKLK